MDERVEVRRLARTELSRVGVIDRSEHIDVLYEQRGTELVARHGDWSASPWDPDGQGEHSVEARRRELEHHVDVGGIALGAFLGARLVGIGVVVPHRRTRRSFNHPRTGRLELDHHRLAVLDQPGMQLVVYTPAS